MATGSVWLTRANSLSALRLGLVLPLVVAIVHARPVLATACFALAVATDFADGWVARRYGESSPLGGLVDHAVDATFVTAGSAALAAQCVLPAALPPLIAVAFLQYVIDSRLVGSPRLLGSPIL